MRRLLGVVVLLAVAAAVAVGCQFKLDDNLRDDDAVLSMIGVSTQGDVHISAIFEVLGGKTQEPKSKLSKLRETTQVDQSTTKTSQQPKSSSKSMEKVEPSSTDDGSDGSQSPTLTKQKQELQLSSQDKSGLPSDTPTVRHVLVDLVTNSGTDVKVRVRILKLLGPYVKVGGVPSIRLGDLKAMFERVLTPNRCVYNVKDFNCGTFVLRLVQQLLGIKSESEARESKPLDIVAEAAFFILGNNGDTAPAWSKMSGGSVIDLKKTAFGYLTSPSLETTHSPSLETTHSPSLETTHSPSTKKSQDVIKSDDSVTDPPTMPTMPIKIVNRRLDALKQTGRKGFTG